MSKKRISHLKIRDKILFYSVLVSVLLMTVFIWASSVYIDWILQKKIQAVSEANVNKVQDYLKNVEYTVSLSLKNASTSITLQNYLMGDSNLEEATQGIIYEVSNRDCISALELYDERGGMRLSSDELKEKKLPEELMEILNADRDKNYWSSQWTDYGPASDLQVFRCVQYKNRVIGYMRVSLSGEAITDIFNYVGFNVSSEMCVLGNNGNLILPKKIEAIYYQAVQKAFQQYSGSDMEAIKYNYADEKYLINCTSLDDYGVIVVVVTRTADMREELAMIQRMIYMLGAICFTLVMFVSWRLSNIVTKPLIRMTKEIEQTGWDNLDLKVDEESYNEIAVLSGAFNEMLERARSLMAEVETAQKRKRELELQILQVQITPHFLYNSLESLSALSLIGDNETVYQMSKALGIFYRDVLSEGRDVIAIDKEVDIVRNYLLVQSIRYRDRFTYRIDVDPMIDNYKIVKLTLQPLVENAIYHGIREVNYPGVLEVTGALEDGCVILRVKDNGKGISKHDQKLESQKERKSGHGDLIMHRKGFGMSNVNERLRLYFGPEYGLIIHSCPGKGTCIEIRLPAVVNEGRQTCDISSDC